MHTTEELGRPSDPRTTSLLSSPRPENVNRKTSVRPRLDRFDLPVAKWLCPVKLHAWCARLQQSVCVWLTLHSKSTSSHLPKPWWLEGSASMTALVSCGRLQFNSDTFIWYEYMQFFRRVWCTRSNVATFHLTKNLALHKKHTASPIGLQHAGWKPTRPASDLMSSPHQRVSYPDPWSTQVNGVMLSTPRPLPVRERATASALHSLAQASISWNTSIRFSHPPCGKCPKQATLTY